MKHSFEFSLVHHAKCSKKSDCEVDQEIGQSSRLLKLWSAKGFSAS